MQARDVIQIVRHQLTDLEAGNYRWPDSLLLAYLEAGQRLLLRARPELWLDDSGERRTASAAVTVTGATLIVEEAWLQALTDYVVYRALIQDSSDTANMERAAIAKAQWEQAVAGG